MAREEKKIHPAYVGAKVKVYKNLHLSTDERPVYSVASARGGRLLGHSPLVALHNVKLKVSEAGRQRVLREKRKNVHAFVIGTLLPHSEVPRIMAEAEAVTYNPYRGASFYTREDDVSVFWATDAVLGSKGLYVVTPSAFARRRNTVVQ